MKTAIAIPRHVLAATWLALCATVPVECGHAAPIRENSRVDCEFRSSPAVFPAAEPLFPTEEHAGGCGAHALPEPLASRLLQGLPMGGLTMNDLEAIDGMAVFSLAADTGRHLARQAVEAVLNGVLAPAGAALPPPAAPVAAPAAEAEVARTVDAWARAWSARDADGYLAHYSPDFSTGETGFSLARWNAQRRTRLLKAPWISVKIRDAQIELQGGDAASVRFVQEYRSPTLSDTSRKVITLRRQGGAWRIVAERTEP